MVKWITKDDRYKSVCIININNGKVYYPEPSGLKASVLSLAPGDFVTCYFHDGIDMLVRNVVPLKEHNDLDIFHIAFKSSNMKLSIEGLTHLFKTLQKSDPIVTNQILSIIRNISKGELPNLFKYVPISYGGLPDILNELSPKLRLLYFAVNYKHAGGTILPDIISKEILNNFDLLDELPNESLVMVADKVVNVLEKNADNLNYRYMRQLLNRPKFIELLHASSISDKLIDIFAHDDLVQIDQTIGENDDYKQPLVNFLFKVARRIIIKNHLVGKLGLKIDDEQLTAISSFSQNVLVTARAGSGKTSTIIHKLIEIVELEKIDPSKVVVLTFNKKAATEVATRASSIINFDNAFTLHSFSRRIIGTVDLLTPAMDDEAIDEQEHIIEQIIDQEMPKDFLPHMYLFFKQYFDLEQRRESLTELQYYSFRRNLTYVSLSGNEVKSIGEKIIADFLWEHGISFKYEKTFKWNKGMYRPDFYFESNGKKIVLEHWAINPEKEFVAILENGINTNKYKEQILAKRKYWEFRKAKDPAYILLETHNEEVTKDRKSFEQVLKTRLEAAGIILEKLSDAERMKRLKKNYSRRITTLFLDFIKKAKKKRFSAADIDELINSPEYRTLNDSRTRAFHHYGKLIFEKYVNRLSEVGKSDFEDLLIQSINEIREKGSDATFLDSNNVSVHIRDLEYLLIDEFQDFNELNFQLIAEIKVLNPKLKLFCVGDNWQAINGFAGSDLSYFEEFESHFSNSERLVISTNYRSCNKIVELGNSLMYGEGPPARSNDSLNQGTIFLKNLNEITLDISDEIDKKFCLKGDVEYISSRYLKFIFEILLENPDKQIAVLSRTKTLFGFDFSVYHNKIKKLARETSVQIIQDTAKKLIFSSAHSYKGLEADVVILLDVIEGRFPLLHQDTVLFEIFGQTISDVLAEEKRLFYVAISRAKEKLYIATQLDRYSEYLPQLGLLPVKKGH